MNPYIHTFYMGTVEYLFSKECLMTRQIFQIYLYWYDYNKTIPDNYSINLNVRIRILFWYQTFYKTKHNAKVTVRLDIL